MLNHGKTVTLDPFKNMPYRGKIALGPLFVPTTQQSPPYKLAHFPLPPFLSFTFIPSHPNSSHHKLLPSNFSITTISTMATQALPSICDFLTSGLVPHNPSQKTTHDHCGICTEPWAPDSSIVSLPCGHHFHQGCMIFWLLTGPGAVASCPFCRRELCTRTGFTVESPNDDDDDEKEEEIDSEVMVQACEEEAENKSQTPSI
jgi:hypothetical protein